MSSSKVSFEGKSQGESDLPASLWYLNMVQFIGAMNDNVFKLLLVYFLIHLQGASVSTTILSIAGAIYVLPFLFFSNLSGIIADQYSKSRIIVVTRFAELSILLFGMVAFYVKSPVLSFVTLFFLAIHSAIFSPCKFGIIPEIVPTDVISRANGILTSFAYIAIIVGTFLASFLTDITGKNFIVSLAICCCFSAVSLVAALKIQKTPPSGSKKRPTMNFIKDIAQTIRRIKREPSLLTAVFGSSFFLFIGSFLQLNMIPYALNVLHITDVQGGYIFLLSAVGIGVGSIVAGKVSGKFIEFGLVPFAGLFMAICCFLLDYYSGSISTVIALAFLFGFFGGLYLVPLDSYIQFASPQKIRGQVVATGNFFSFLFVFFSAVSLYIFGDVLHIPPDHSFTYIGYVTLAISIAITISMYGYLVRFASFLISKLFYPQYLHGYELVPLNIPSVFLVPQSMWPWAFVLLASQRHRMRIFDVSESSSSSLPKMIKRLAYVDEVETLSSLAPDEEYGEKFSHSLSRGTSIAIFCSKKILQEYKDSFFSQWKTALPQPIPAFFYVRISEEGLKKTPQDDLCAYIEPILV